jgi:hypothetical protein
MDRGNDTMLASDHKVLFTKNGGPNGGLHGVKIMSLVGVPHSDRIGSWISKAYDILSQDYHLHGNKEPLKADTVTMLKGASTRRWRLNKSRFFKRCC